MARATDIQQGRLKLIKNAKSSPPTYGLRTINLFSGAGGITEGFRQAGYECLYANDSMPEAVKTFKDNHHDAWADCRSIEEVKPNEVRA